MISVVFSLPKKQDGRHIVLSMLSDLLKIRKNEVTISLLNLKYIFWPNTWDLALIKITIIFLY